MEPFFGIRIATYRRRKGTHHLLHRCLRSILRQTYTNWKVFLIGDHYVPNFEFVKLASIIPQDKITYLNLPFSPEREKYTGLDLWKIAGLTASNTGLKMIQQEGLIHVPIDDDDYFLSQHLSVLADAYTQFTEATFIYTQSTYRNQVLPQETPEIYYNNLPPRAYNVIHSAISWDTRRIPLMYENIIETGANYVAGDAAMLERIGQFCEENNMKTLYIPKITVRHDYEQSIEPMEPLLL